MDPASRRQIKQMREEVEAEYLPLADALFSTGFSKAHLLKWCAERNIRHIKRHNRWLIHKKDLLAAMQADLYSDATSKKATAD